LDKIRQTIYLERDLKEKLRYLSYKEKLTQNDIIKEALRGYLKDKVSDSDIKQIMAVK
jgi:predicted DNA-binding protein